MADFDNTNKGAFWKNTKKESDRHPDFIGSQDIDGVQYWVSGWKRKEGASEKSPALSFTIKLKEGKQESGGNKNRQSIDNDNDLPF